jgi:hypothetical protein
MQSDTACTAPLARCGNQWLVQMWHATMQEQTAHSPVRPVGVHAVAADTAEVSVLLPVSLE